MRGNLRNRVDFGVVFVDVTVRETCFLTDPNYVIRCGDRLFSVSSDAQGEYRGCVGEIDASGAMRVLAQEETAGNAPCFLCASPDGRYLYCPNYGTGSIAVFPIEGGLKPRIQLVVHSGSGPHPTRQTAPHVHQALFIPGTQYLCACDLGTDEIVVYRADKETGILARHSALHQEASKKLHSASNRTGNQSVPAGNENRADRRAVEAREITLLRKSKKP